jgi:hypothetical protein
MQVTNEIIRVLMDRDGFAYDEACEVLIEARMAVENGEDPSEVLYEHFGLEPDYIHDLI